MSDEHQFSTEFSREHRSISEALRRRQSAVWRLLEPVLRDGDRLLALSAEEIVDRALATTDEDGDVLGHPADVQIRPGRISQDLAVADNVRPREGEYTYLPCWVWRLPFDCAGPKDLFGRWPDAEDEGLRVFDNDQYWAPVPKIVWTLGDRTLRADCYYAQTEWPLGEEPTEELRAAFDAERTTPPEELFSAAVEHVMAYSRAVNRQVAAWTVAVREELLAAVAEEQRRRGVGRANRDSANERLARWRVDPVEKPRSIVAAAAQEHSSPRINLTPIFPVANFEDVIRVVNRWGEAVAKYSAAFLGLEEERLADLLTATLNGAFARAEREVFIGGGKSDFYVTAHTLGLEGMAEAFVGEAKIWKGEQGFHAAVAQAIGNLTARTSRAILVVFVRDRRSFSRARDAGLAAMGRRRDVIERGDDVAGTPAFRLRSSVDEHATIEVALIFVDLTRRPELLPKRKGASRGSS